MRLHRPLHPDKRNMYKIAVFGLLLLCARSCVSGECNDGKIKYEIVRFNKMQMVPTNYESDVITNDAEAYYVNITGPVRKFCQGTIDIQVRSYHFWCDVPSLEEIESGAFEKQNIQEQIRISLSQVTVIKSKTFHDMPAKEIALLNNKIEKIEDDAFSNLPNLTTLYLSDNDLTELSPKAIVNTPSLRWFDIGGNKLKKLSADFFSFFSKGQITGIGMGGNNLEEIDPKTFQDVNVYALSLSNNSLIQIPDSLFESKSLADLHLEDNKLTSLSEKFFDVKTFINVNLTGNDLNCETVQKLKNFAEKNDFLNEDKNTQNFFTSKRLLFDIKDC